MKHKKIVLLTMVTLAVLLLTELTAAAAPMGSPSDRSELQETGWQSCILPCTDDGVQPMSADGAQSQPLVHQKLLTILIEFNDIQIKMGSAFWNRELFDTTPGALSVVNYWKENANGLDVFEPADTTGIPTGKTGRISYKDYTDIAFAITERADGVIRVSLDIPHPMPTGSESSIKLQNAAMAAIGAIEEEFDFSDKALHIVTVFAGYGQLIAQGTAGKGHIRGFTSSTGVKTPGGVMLNRYTVQPELYSPDIPYGIGTICHELGHSVFNLPDLYFEKAMGADNTYTLMANGNNGRRYDHADKNKPYDDPYAQCTGHVPTHLDPWCKMQCGFVTPEIVSDWDGMVNSISDMGTDSAYNVVKVQSKANPKQYFLIENRQLIGFDKGLERVNIMAKYPYHNLFAGGILIWHIDENVRYSKHNNEAQMHQFISVERSNSSSENDYLWAYINQDGRNIFDTATAPNSNFHQTKIPGETCSLSADCHPQSVKSGISIEVLGETGPSMQIRVRVEDAYKIAEIPQYQYSIKYESQAAVITVPQDGTYTVIFAAYDTDNRLLNVYAEDCPLVKGENRIAPPDFSANHANTVKVMLWDSLNGIKPLCATAGK